MKRQTLIFASGNKGKLAEVQSYFADLDMTVCAQTQFSVAAAAETGLSFVENAIIKARHAAEQTQQPAFADDSGLIVDSLQGAPGLYTARYAGPNATDKENNDKLIHTLNGNPKRQASFHCTIAYFRYPNDPDPFIAQGIWHGQILTTPSGAKGFGYDPIFYVPTHQCSSAELEPTEKNRISHRGQALQLLKNRLTTAVSC